MIDPDPVPEVGTTSLRDHYRVDLRTGPPTTFVELGETDWGRLSWKRVGRPALVQNYSRHRQEWEARAGRDMPVPIQWEHFNRHFHELFLSRPDEASPALRSRLRSSLGSFQFREAAGVIEDLLQLHLWNYVHRVRDAVWDPRGKRALFEGLGMDAPRILFLGAADGYEAMQLLAMYPGGHAVLVDYDEFCRTERFGAFPETYPFLGQNPATGAWTVYHRPDFSIDFIVRDIRDLDLEPEFDIVISVGLLEHFPDEHKPLAVDFHRRFLKPGGIAIFTTPRRQLRSRLFYLVMGEIMNFGYRELMDARQLGLYVHENGFEVLRAGYIQAHNGVIARPR